MNLFGKPDDFHDRPNVFGELMRVLISPLENGKDPNITLYMRMLMNRY